MSWFRRDGDDVVLQVLVQPRASREGFGAVVGDRLKIALTAPPVEGAANVALCTFLARQFDVPRRRVVVESGVASRRKRVRILSASVPPAALTQLGASGARDQ